MDIRGHIEADRDLEKAVLSCKLGAVQRFWFLFCLKWAGVYSLGHGWEWVGVNADQK